MIITAHNNTMVRNFFQESLASALSDAEVIFNDEIYRARNG
ncbi:MAG: hypothetical protein U1F27_00835 [Turneriella sp.]